MENKRIKKTITSPTEYNLGRIPPSAIELEEAVLGAIMLEKDALIEIKEFLKPEFFYKESHQRIYQAIQQLDEDNEPIDILTVTQKLKKNGDLNLVGGAYYITQLTSRVASSANIEYHSHIILQKFMQRELIRYGSDIIRNAFEDTIDVIDLIDKTGIDFNNISELQHGKSNKVTFAEVLKESFIQLEKRELCVKENKLTGIPTGLKDLDKQLNGWQNTDLIIIASRPSMGKTAVSLFWARIASQYNFHVLYFSLEMIRTKLADRIIIAEAKIDSDKYNSGYIPKEEKILVESKLQELKKRKIDIDDKSGVKINYIKTQAQIAKRRGECDIIFIDYLQLINAAHDNKQYNREAEISFISRTCKQIAKELNVPVILLCQLSRECEKRGGSKKPILSDLRESGAIEQDADIVIFPYRPHYYGLTVNGVSTFGEGEFIIAKNRNGMTGMVNFRHNKSITNFYDWDYEEFAPPPPDDDTPVPF